MPSFALSPARLSVRHVSMLVFAASSMVGQARSQESYSPPSASGWEVLDTGESPLSNPPQPSPLPPAESHDDPGSMPAAPDYRWRRGDEVVLPNPGDIVEQPLATGMPPAGTRRATELQANLGVAWLTCPLQAGGCSAEAGILASVAWFQRPVGWFSWGLGLDAQQFSQTWTISEEVWSLSQQAFSGRLLARVHMNHFGGIDPYIGISLGGAAIHDRYQNDGETSTPRWVGSPLYGARAGIVVQVGERVRVGGLIDWTNIQANTGESCPWVVGGVCSANNWSAFSPANALWNVAVTVSFAFGEEL